jgi:uncharacterized peroxidase-related enzyme
MFLSHPAESAEVDALFEKARQESGYVSNYLKLWAWRPDVYASFVAARMLALDTTLSQREIALINAATAATRGDSYCAIAWGARVATAFDAPMAAAVLSGGDVDGLSQREAALLAWTRVIVRDPNSVESSDVERLRAAGLGDREIFEATFLAATRMAFGTVNDALGALPDAALASQAPKEVLDSVCFGRPPECDPKAGFGA